MGLISRHPGAPFQDGEILSGPDLEADIATVYDAVNGNIDTVNIKDNAITTAKILNGSVTQAKLDGTLVASVADASITTVKIADLAVTNAKLAADAVTQSKIASGAVTQAKILIGSAAGWGSSFVHTATTLTTSYQTIASTVHLTGSPASLVVVTASFTVTGLMSSGRSLEYTVEKDGVSLLGSGNVDTHDFIDGIVTEQFQITRVYVDRSPTTLTNHAYALKVRYQGTAGSPTIKDIVWLIHEPRS